jgi:hypothetical protein
VSSRLARNVKGELIVVDDAGRIYRVLGNQGRTGEDGWRMLGETKARPPTESEQIEAATGHGLARLSPRLTSG